MEKLSYAKSQEIKDIIEKFNIMKGQIKKISTFDNGRIHKTYKVVIRGKNKDKTYLLQEINTNVFTNTDKLIQNIVDVTNYINENGGTSIVFINVKSNKNEYLLKKIQGRDSRYFGCFRCYEYIEADVYQCVNSPSDMYILGKAVAGFAKSLEKYDVNTLHETIPDFHNTPKRFEDLLISIYECSKKDPKRLANVYTLINTIISRRENFSIITDGLKSGEIPTRVTHNDPKLNNVLFDKETGEPICMIDLDTVMPGSILYDIGDAIRYCANTASEEEKDTSNVHFKTDLCIEFIKGYMEVMRDILTPKEIEYMYRAPEIMAWELAIRFLTDYLNGNKYFKVDYDTQNVDRAKVQATLAINMEMKSYEIKKFIDSLIKNKN